MDGGVNNNQAFYLILIHIGPSAFVSWVSALLVINNLLSGELVNQLWAPILIAGVIAALMSPRFSVTPAIIYGYASIWAFPSVSGLFSQDILLLLSFQNAFVAIGFCILLGACAGYINALMIVWLCSIRLTKSDTHNN